MIGPMLLAKLVAGVSALVLARFGGRSGESREPGEEPGSAEPAASVLVERR